MVSQPLLSPPRTASKPSPPLADLINGEDGDDLASGGAGDDTKFGASGNNILYGEAGNDQIRKG
jgi:hypothetical protein